MVPGPSSYSDVVKRANNKVSVFSSSITKGVNVRRMNKQFNGDKIIMHRFHGKKAHHIKQYVPIHMKEDKPDTCVIVAGGNDLPGRAPVLEIANNLMEAGILCKNHGASKVIISSVLPRQDSYCQARREQLNKVLIDLCHLHNFVYMDNWNISSCNLQSDGVHLNVSGSDQLEFNFLWYLNSS